MSKISVTTIAGLTSGGDANKVKIESGDTSSSRHLMQQSVVHLVLLVQLQIQMDYYINTGRLMT